MAALVVGPPPGRIRRVAMRATFLAGVDIHLIGFRDRVIQG
jgi:hypothetical protein